MKQLLIFLVIISTLIFANACQSNERATTLQKCKILANESIVYARASYVKLFHYFNPNKFSQPYAQVKEFDHVTHRNIINTYDMAINKLKSTDEITLALLSSCKALADFSRTLADQSYPRAISHKSEHKPLTNSFFIEINQIVKFDHSIGEFNPKKVSFKQQMENYRIAMKNYIDRYKAELPEELLK